MTTWFVGLVVALASSAEPAKPKVEKAEASKPVAEAVEKKPKLRLRKRKPSKEKKDSKASPLLPGAPKRKGADPEAPNVPQRPIPGPEQREAKRSELDRQLIDELGRDLETVEEETSDPLLRAGKKMRTVEESLAKLDDSAQTIDLQGQIVKDLDELLEQMRQQRNNSGGKSGAKGKNAKQQRLQKQRMAQQGKKQGKRNGQSSDSRDAAMRGRLGRLNTGETEIVKNVWGHLSNMMRQEMSQYAKDAFLPRYREMLERYYTEIATESRSDSESAP